MSKFEELRLAYKDADKTADDQPSEFESLYDLFLPSIRRKFAEKCQEAMRQNKPAPTTFDI